MRYFIEKLVNFLINRAITKGERYLICGQDLESPVYLVRYLVYKSKRFGCCYIHKFLRSDSDDPHDHPWNFLTYVVSKGYSEKYYDKTNPQIFRHRSLETSLYWGPLAKVKVNRRNPGSLAYRRATDIHQVIVDKEIHLLKNDFNESKIKDAPLTICLMGPTIRDWGFWDKDCKVFTDWRHSLGITPDDPRFKGSE